MQNIKEGRTHRKEGEEKQKGRNRHFSRRAEHRAGRNVINLTDQTLTTNQLKLLDLGLSFCPTPRIDVTQHIYDQAIFDRKLRIHHHFRKEEQKPSTSSFEKKKSAWTPQTGQNQCLDLYLGSINEEIKNLKSTKKTGPNLTKKLQAALKELKENKDIIIKPADKGGAIVIWSKEQYLKEAERQLSNKQHYKRLFINPTKEYEKKIIDFLVKANKEGWITTNTRSNISPKNSRTPTFYMLPKVHKPNVPGRPIVSAIQGPTDKISRYVDHHLIQLVSQSKSYIKDTTDVILKIREIGQISKESILCTVDVSALYTNIPHKEGIEACYKTLEKRIDKSPPTQFLTQLIKFILELNAFEFNRIHYQQVQGTAMGTCMAPSYANIFMSNLEEEFLETQASKPLIWWRFIDDILMIWTHGEDSLEKFLTDLNQFHSTIKFTHEKSTNSIPFLDIRIHLKDGTLTTSTFTKATDRSTYLHFKSSHPITQKKAIPYSQMVRMVRNNTEEEDKMLYIKTIGARFLERGYPPHLIQEAEELALKLTQEETLKPKPKNELDSIIYVSTYNPNIPKLKEILNRDMRILSMSPDTEDIPKKPLMIAYKRPPNLRDILVHSRFYRPPVTPGNTRCTAKHCQACRLMKVCTTFKHRTNGNQYKVRGQITCTTNNVIYMIQCKKCGKQYIGQTENPVKFRINAHVSDIKRKDRYKPVAVHFSSKDHTQGDMTWLGLMTSSDDIIKRLTWERTWIRQLDTTEPQGLNRKE